MKTKVLFKNSAMGFLGQLIAMIFQFACRKVFLDYIGVELLGLSSTFTSILNTLSLAELGFQNAIIYSLYVPLNRGDTDKVNKIVNIYKTVYRWIAILISGASLVCLPLLPSILTDIEIGTHVYLIFALQAMQIIFTYLIAYKRSLLYADQKDYIAKLIDMICLIVSNILEIIIIVNTGNYYLYLILKIVNTLVSNFIVHVYCKKYYPYLHKVDTDRNLLREIVSNVKQIFVAKIAGYIYNCTDNLVISKMISTVSVGYLVNYTTITQALKALIESILRPVIPFVGRYINEDGNSKDKDIILFNSYTYARFFIACVIVIPFYLLVDEFIIMLYGNEFVMPRLVTILICAEMYIYFVHGGTTAFINGKGLFREEKKVEIIGALSNLITSIIFAKILGLPGVLLGTVISQMLYWIGRSFLVYNKVFGASKLAYIKYWLVSIKQLIVFVIAAISGHFICELFVLQNAIFQFVLKGIASELIIGLVFGILMFNDETQKRLLKALTNKTIKG